MRRLFSVGILVSGICLGCASRKKTPSATNPVFSNVPAVIITPEHGLAGKVVRVNTQARFAVLNFPLGQMPAMEQRLNVYRRGLKTGEVKVTGPQRDDNIVADVVTGNAEPGDEVRDR